MTQLDHVALVVPDLEACLERLRESCGGAIAGIGPIEAFPSEGTREVYVGSAGGRLLLMQPTTSKGPYAEALKKRGPGLHHVAVTTPDLDAYVAALRGWLLHPRSVATIARSRTAWLARPGIPTLVEVQEAEPPGESSKEKAFVSSVEIPAPLDGLTPIAGLVPSLDPSCWITLDGYRVAVDFLVSRPGP